MLIRITNNLIELSALQRLAPMDRAVGQRYAAAWQRLRLLYPSCLRAQSATWWSATARCGPRRGAPGAIRRAKRDAVDRVSRAACREMMAALPANDVTPTAIIDVVGVVLETRTVAL
jgi:hypothetical protein